MNNTYPVCTNKQTATYHDRTYPYDCAKCPECLRAIEMIRAEIRELGEKRRAVGV